ncbi:copper chaperone PCu(A)C [Algihabitans albus]|uniref:copper chaperone PCu(A)C n=1 Tax=Algihabitans albus TaxID=2164067 RepID=UPI000E5D8075|nr:copper chaperone PCu(A)C [Algihabitans albus]
MKEFVAGFCLLALATATAIAHDFKAGAIHIDHPWARASVGMAKAGAAYMLLTNEGSEPDRLIKASAEVAEAVELHTHLMEEGVMRMRQVEAIEVEPGTPSALEPGGLHVMLIGLKQPLVAGESFPMTLTFEQAGEVTVEVSVEAMGSDMGGHDHSATPTQ